MSIRRSRSGQLVKLLVAISTTAALAVSTAGPAGAERTQVPPSTQGVKGGGTDAAGGLYIVQLAGDPVVAYSGDIAGLAATRPAPGKKINPLANNVVRYVDHLTARHNDALAAVGGGRKAYSYTYSYNGFAASLTEQQAAKLAQQPGVLSVTPNEMQYLETSSTPTFLGLTAPGGLYDQLGGIGSAGEDVIIGVVDSGVWPENPAFSDRTALNGNVKRDGRLGYRQIPGWHGRCVPGEQFTASNCNQKLIGARYYNAGFGGNAGIDATLPFEFNSPRDHNGHGSHTASTAGGNANVATTGPASVFGSISGIAPRARIAAYKACWSVPGTAGSCSGVDLLAAIDQAVADGVDVINYSISGTSSNFRDPVEIAFLFAADAGIFVATSAGNSGPAESTVAHPSPWVTTVAAGTHNRNGSGSVTLGNGITYFGASVATAVGPAPLINATAAGVTGANSGNLARCYSSGDNGGVAVLDPAKVAGKIVVCDRGGNARVNKSQAVEAAGGVGMILVNPTANSLNADFHFVPTVHLQNTDRAAVQAYAATSGATATINPATIAFTEPAPFTASFSSRGPLIAGAGDLLKPDVIAPGQDILAAVAPPNNAGRDFDLYSGTSMSSPHVAGLAALLTQLHPSWSPMAIKSALMTSAYDVLDGPNTDPSVIFSQGAGHVRPNSAANPGLVYDSSFNDWLAFICTTQPQGLEATCASVFAAGFSQNPSDFNSPSIAIGALAGAETVTRTVTNVSGAPITVTANVTGMDGITTAVNPTSLTLAANETKSYTVSFTRTSAELNAYTGGQLTWTGGVYSVRSPIVVRPVALSAPAEVNDSYSVTFGYDGPFTATARGLVPAVTTVGTVNDDPTDSTCSLESPNAQHIPVIVPAGTTYARFSLFDADVAPGSDLDVCVFDSTGELVGASGSGTSAEEVNLLNPAADTYTVVVQGWGVVGSSPFSLHTWLLGTVDAENMIVTAPGAAVTGTTGDIVLEFKGLTPGTKYLGSVVYGGVEGLPDPTIVRVDFP